MWRMVGLNMVIAGGERPPNCGAGSLNCVEDCADRRRGACGRDYGKHGYAGREEARAFIAARIYRGFSAPGEGCRGRKEMGALFKPVPGESLRTFIVSREWQKLDRSPPRDGGCGNSAGADGGTGADAQLAMRTPRGACAGSGLAGMADENFKREEESIDG